MTAQKRSAADLVSGKRAMVSTRSIPMDPDAELAFRDATEEVEDREGKVREARIRARLNTRGGDDDDSSDPGVEEAEKKLDQARKALTKAEKELDDTTVVFKQRAIPQKVLRKLMLDHPPTEDQKAEFKAELAKTERPEGALETELPYNTDTYPPALLEKTLVEPKMSADEISDQIWNNDEWSESEKQVLFNQALELINRAPLAR